VLVGKWIGSAQATKQALPTDCIYLAIGMPPQENKYLHLWTVDSAKKRATVCQFPTAAARVTQQGDLRTHFR